MEKSPDAFRTISEVAEYLETPAHVLRFWESRFPQIKPVKRAGGRRYYRPSDVALLAGIRRLLHDEGMTIRGVQKMLREQGVRQVAAFGSDGAALEEVFAVDERLLEGIPGVGPEPPSAEILSFQARPRTDEDGLSVTDPNLREGEEPEMAPVVEPPRAILPPIAVTALEVQGEDVAPLAAGIGPVRGDDATQQAGIGEMLAGEAVDQVDVEEAEVEEAPFLDTEAEPDWREAETAELHRLHPEPVEESAEEDGFFAGPEADWEPEEEAAAEEGSEPVEELPAAEDLSDLAALDGVRPDEFEALLAEVLKGQDEIGQDEAGDLADDNLFLDAGLEEAWAGGQVAEPAPEPEAEPEAELREELVAEVEAAEIEEPAPAPLARQGDLWSAAGIAAPPAVAPKPRGADLLVEETDDLLDVDLASVLPVLGRLRTAEPEALAEQAAELAALRDRLLALREGMAAAARVRAR